MALTVLAGVGAAPFATVLIALDGGGRLDVEMDNLAFAADGAGARLDAAKDARAVGTAGFASRAEGFESATF